MDRLSLNGSAIKALTDDPGVIAQLADHADDILARAKGRAPSWLDARWFVKAGVGPQGGFAQAIARGSGAVLAEYGGRRSPAYSMFRSSIR